MFCNRCHLFLRDQQPGECPHGCPQVHHTLEPAVRRRRVTGPIRHMDGDSIRYHCEECDKEQEFAQIQVSSDTTGQFHSRDRWTCLECRGILDKFASLPTEERVLIGRISDWLRGQYPFTRGGYITLCAMADAIGITDAMPKTMDGWLRLVMLAGTRDRIQDLINVLLGVDGSTPNIEVIRTLFREWLALRTARPRVPTPRRFQATIPVARSPQPFVRAKSSMSAEQAAALVHVVTRSLTATVLDPPNPKEKPMQPATSTSPTGEKIASAPTSVIDRLTASARETAFAAATATLSELGQASWQMRAREAARLGVGLTMRGLDKSLRGTKGAKPFIVGLRAALDTELGLAAYAVAAGTVMSAIPRVTAKPSRKRLASELRIFGFRTIMERYADPFVDGLLGIFDTVLEGTTDADAETP